MCCDVGRLQAYLDQELNALQKSEVESHLSVCEECRGVLLELEENKSFVNTRLEAYTREINFSDQKVKEAWRRFSERHVRAQSKRSKFKEVLHSMKGYKTAAVAGVLALVLATGLSFSSVRGFAGELLSVFRVEKVQTIDINPQDLAKMQETIKNGAGQVNIDHFGKMEVSGNNQDEIVTLEKAQQAVDFAVKLPADLPAGYTGPVLHKSSGSTVSFTLDVNNVNQLLNSLGSSKFLPKELDNKTFTMQMPVNIGAEYTGKNGAHLFVAQSRSPEMVVPEGVQVNQIRDALLSIPALPDSLRKQLAAVNDWQHTVLIPNVGGSSREVQVNGVQGVYMRSPGQQNGSEGALIWQKDGVVYLIAGKDLSLSQAQAMAESMR